MKILDRFLNGKVNKIINIVVNEYSSSEFKIGGFSTRHSFHRGQSRPKNSRLSRIFDHANLPAILAPPRHQVRQTDQNQL
jgi:hypothetical protein